MSESSVVGKLFRFVFFLVLIVVGWTEVWPRLQAKISGSMDSCISNVQAQTDHFARRMKDFDTRRADQDAWLKFRADLEKRIQSGRELCSCDKPSCRKGRSALSELERLSDGFHAFIKGGNRVEHPKERIAAIDELIREGRKLNQSGQ